MQPITCSWFLQCKLAAEPSITHETARHKDDGFPNCSGDGYILKLCEGGAMEGCASCPNRDRPRTHTPSRLDPFAKASGKDRGSSAQRLWLVGGGWQARGRFGARLVVANVLMRSPSGSAGAPNGRFRRPEGCGCRCIEEASSRDADFDLDVAEPAGLSGAVMDPASSGWAPKLLI